MPTYQFHIQGQVQGVGFRPFVSRMAKRLDLNGWVNNGKDGVHIHVSGSEDACRVFIKELKSNPPPLANITSMQMELIETLESKDFRIIESDKEANADLLLTPDVGLCDVCRSEIKDLVNRRFEYAFTTCTNCGPRYSIIQSLPYDRENTTMSDFEICPSCQHEFEDPEDRRYYSQTNSCSVCGVTLSLLDNQGKMLTQVEKEVIDFVADALSHGKIIAIKGIGGFLLLVDAANSNAIKLLRERKQRPSKPFALLYPSLEMIEVDAIVSQIERQELKSIVNPIVLLTVRRNAKHNLALEQISPGLSRIGVMLPCTPLLELIADRYGKPLVATSGNISGSPIFYQNNKALENLSGIADYFVVDNRDIVVPQDDSVVQFTPGDHRIILRRSRGMAPTYLPNPFTNKKQTVFAAGSDLKCSFAFLNRGNLCISQYLGDLESFETQEVYQRVLNHFLKLFDAKPSYILVDSHPNYYSSQIGKELAATWEAPVIEVQHHIAHFSAVLAENKLIQSPEPVLGIIWDGTGWGDDGQIWGGEFFIYDHFCFNRVLHLDYVDHLLGDKTSREPRLSALSLCFDLEEAHGLIKQKFSSIEWDLYNGMLQRPGNLKTSSMGRLFDGVASLLGLCDKSSYEGEAALLLEACATSASVKMDSLGHQSNFSLKSYLKKLVIEIQLGTPKEILAFQFHLALVHWIEEVAMYQEIKNLAFSGGVFQNTLLTDLILNRLGSNYKFYFNKQVSPNDECIGFGQLAYDEIQSNKAISLMGKKLKTETI